MPTPLLRLCYHFNPEHPPIGNLQFISDDTDIVLDGAFTFIEESLGGLGPADQMEIEEGEEDDDDDVELSYYWSPAWVHLEVNTHIYVIN
jgi:hypothetical protein